MPSSGSLMMKSALAYRNLNLFILFQRIMNQYPLHRISYCADDKGEKKFFSFIAKEQDSDHHVCFVFVSDKLVSIGMQVN